MKRLLDKTDDVTEYFHYDELTDTSTIEVVQDVEPYIESAKAIRNETDKSEGIKKGWWKYAHIPDSIILKMKFEDGVDIFDKNDWPKIGKLLDDKYAAFKVTDGRHKFKA